MPPSLLSILSFPQALDQHQAAFGPHEVPYLGDISLKWNHVYVTFWNWLLSLRNLWLCVFFQDTLIWFFPLFTCYVFSDSLTNLHGWIWNTEPCACGANILPLSLLAPSPILISVFLESVFHVSVPYFSSREQKLTQIPLLLQRRLVLSDTSKLVASFSHWHLAPKQAQLVCCLAF